MEQLFSEWCIGYVLFASQYSKCTNSAKYVVELLVRLVGFCNSQLVKESGKVVCLLWNSLNVEHKSRFTILPTS